jgi:hypothetical protein
VGGAFTEFAGAADRLGGEDGNPGWAPFRRLGDAHMRFHYPASEVTSSTEVVPKAVKARRAKLMKDKAKFGKSLEGLSSDDEFVEPEKEVAGVELLVRLLDQHFQKVYDVPAY